MKVIELYTTENNEAGLSVAIENNSVWLNQQQLSILFSRERSVISKHISNIFREGELNKEAVCAFFAHTGKKQQMIQILN